MASIYIADTLIRLLRLADPLCAMLRQELDASPRRRGGTRQRLGSRDHLAGDLGAPLGEVMGHFKGNRHKLQPPDFPEIGQHAFAVIVRWWLCELARTRDIAASNIEPITLHPPLRNVRHGWPPFCQENVSASCRLYRTGRCERGSRDNTATVYGIASLRIDNSSILPHRKIDRDPYLSSAEDIEWLRQKPCGNVPHRTVLYRN